MIGDAKENGHPVLIVNDTLKEVEGHFSIKDADTNEVLKNGKFRLGKNGKFEEGFLPTTEAPKLWLIEWEVDNKKYTNHYFAYQPHVDLEVYLKWLPKLKPNR
mgnify:CR=1 FL=1